MTAYAILDSTGQFPVALGRGPEAPLGALILPDSTDIDDLLGQMLTPDGWVERPCIAAPTRLQSGPDQILHFVALPVGTVLQVTDVEAAELLTALTITTDPDVTLHLTAGARFRVELAPPAPWMPLEIGVPT